MSRRRLYQLAVAFSLGWIEACGGGDAPDDGAVDTGDVSDASGASDTRDAHDAGGDAPDDDRGAESDADVPDTEDVGDPDAETDLDADTGVVDGPTFGPLVFVVDPTIGFATEPDDLPRDEAGELVPLDSVVGPDGAQADFVAGHLEILSDDPDAVATLAARFGGEIVIAPAEWDIYGTPSYVVRVDPALGDTEGLPARLAAGVAAIDLETGGEHRVTSEAALGLLSIFAEATADFGLAVAPLWVMSPSTIADGSTYEGDAEGVDFSPDACTWDYLSDGPGGLGIGVCAAWQSMVAAGTVSLTSQPPQRYSLMLLDDNLSGRQNHDEFTLDSAVWVESGDSIASETIYPGRPPSCDSQHGVALACVAAGFPDNGELTAGPAGPLGTRLVFAQYDYRYALSTLRSALAFGLAAVDAERGQGRVPVRIAVLGRSGAAVPAGLWQPPYSDQVNGLLADYRARGILLLAASEVETTYDGTDSSLHDVDAWAYNGRGERVETSLTYPCELNDVLCVGAVETSPGREIVHRANYGTDWSGNSVDLTGPFRAYMADPCDDFGDKSERGSSVAAAFVGGVAAMVLTQNPSLDTAALERRLIETARGSFRIVDAEAAVGVPEVCDGRDNDGDDSVDEAAPGVPITRPCAIAGNPVGVGECRAGVETCEHDRRPSWRAPTTGERATEAECRRVCFWLIDCFLEDSRDYLGCLAECQAADYAQVDCGDSGLSCARVEAECGLTQSPASTWSACAGEVVPSAEVCDARDNDCDGAVDEGEGGGLLSVECSDCAEEGVGGVGSCRWGASECIAGAIQPCHGFTCPETEVAGSGLDEDCDGLTDEPAELPPPTGVTASNGEPYPGLPDRVELSWSPVPGAQGYRVWRFDTGGRVLLGETAEPAWIDTTAPAPVVSQFLSTSASPAVIDVQMLLDWEVGVQRLYEVTAYFESLESPPSERVRGRRGWLLPAGADLAVGDSRDAACRADGTCAAAGHVCLAERCRELVYSEVTAPDVWSWRYRDEGADPPTLSGGTVTASDGTLPGRVGLTLSDLRAARGATRSYWGRVHTNLGASPWMEASSARSADPSTLPVTWERTADDSDGGRFYTLPGLSGPRVFDASEDGTGHHYRAAIWISPATAYRTAPDRGHARMEGFSRVSVGEHHACGILAAGGVECWGDDDFGQSSVPDPLLTQVEARGYHTCGLHQLGFIACWGQGFGTSGRAVSPAGERFFSFTGADTADSTWEICGVRADGTGLCFDAASGASLPDQPSGTWRRFVNPWCGVRTDGSAECFRPWGDLEWDIGAEGVRYPGPYLDFQPVPRQGGLGGLTGWLTDLSVQTAGVVGTDAATGVSGAFSDYAFAGSAWTSAPSYTAAAACGVVEGEDSLACTPGGATATPPACADYVDVEVGSAPVDGARSACAIRLNGDVDCWGADAGIRGGPASAHPEPAPLHGLAMSGYARAGGGAGAAIDEHGNVHAWGSWSFGYWYPSSPPLTPTWRIHIDHVPPAVGASATYTLSIDGHTFETSRTRGYVEGVPETPDQFKRAVAERLAWDINTSATVSLSARAHVAARDYDPRAAHVLIEPRRPGMTYDLRCTDTDLDAVVEMPAAGIAKVETVLGGGAALGLDGRVYTWGFLRNREGIGAAVFPLAAEWSAITALECGTASCCAQRADGRLFCFDGGGADACGDGRCAALEMGGACVDDCADGEVGSETGDLFPWFTQLLPAELGEVRYGTFGLNTSIACGYRLEDGALDCWHGSARLETEGTWFGALASIPGATVEQIVISDVIGCALRESGDATCVTQWSERFEYEGPFIDLAVSNEGFMCAVSETGAGSCRNSMLYGGASNPGIDGLTWPGPYVNVETAEGVVCFERETGGMDCTDGYYGEVTPPRAGVRSIEGGEAHLCVLGTDDVASCAAPIPQPCDGWRSIQLHGLDIGAGCGVENSGRGRCFSSRGEAEWEYWNGEVPEGPWAHLVASETGSFACGIHASPGAAFPGDGGLECFSGSGAEPVFGPDVALPGIHGGYVEITAGSEAACARTDQGVVVCAASGSGASAATYQPHPDLRFRAIDMSGRVLCGLDAVGGIRCTGPDLGEERIVTGTGNLAFDLSGSFLCVVERTSTVRCLSLETGAWLDDGPFHSSLRGAGYVDVVAMSYNVCGLRDDGTMDCAVPMWR